MRARHILVLALWSAVFSLPFACGPADAPATRGPSRLSRFTGDGRLAAALFAAAQEYAVPVEVLAAAAWSETRFRFRDAEGGESEGRGLFQLDPWAIDEAAAGLRETPERVASDPETHARAFAWLMLRGAAEAGALPPADDTDPWLPFLPRTRANVAAGEALVEGASWALARGFTAEVDGERLALEPDVFGRAWQANRPDQPGVAYVQSVNYRNSARRRGDVDTVVIHVTQGSYGGTISWFQNPASEVSSHYVVRSSDGEITQMVEEEDVAWHASCWNGRSVGIEHEGFVDDPAWFTDEMYRASAALTRGICERWGIPMDRDHIKGHVELSDCNDHTDPGRHWDWDRYIAMVRGDDVGPPPAPVGSLIGFVRVGDLHNEAQPVAGARVAVRDGPEVRSAENGLYEVGELAPGRYVLDITAEGFVPVTLERDVMAGEPTWGSVGLEAAAAPPPTSDAPPPASEAPPPASEPPPPVDERPDDAAALPPATELDAAIINAGGEPETPVVPAAPTGPGNAEVPDVKAGGPAAGQTRRASYEGAGCRVLPGAGGLPRTWLWVLPAALLARAARRRGRRSEGGGPG